MNIKPLYAHLADVSQTVDRIQAGHAWCGIWREVLRMLCDDLPSGSGFDSGSEMIVASNTELKFNTAYHHMNDGGMYCGWSEHQVIVRAIFGGITIRVTGRDRNDIKQYIDETFRYALTLEVDLDPLIVRAKTRCDAPDESPLGAPAPKPPGATAEQISNREFGGTT